MADSKHHDIVVIGAGPGGYVAAIRAAQLGLDVACVEKESALGGTCLRIGCIPSKALLESSELFHVARDSLAEHGVNTTGVALDLQAMLARKDKVVGSLVRGIDGLFGRNKVTRYLGHATLTGPGQMTVTGEAGETALTADHIVVATGSQSAPLAGVELDGDRIGTSTEALAYPEVPEHLVVIGAGVIGLELGSVWLRLGAKVTVLEYLDRILPGMDTEIARDTQRILRKQGFEFRLSSRVTGARLEGDGCVVTVDGADPTPCDRVLLAVGRRPNTEGLGLDSVGIQLDRHGHIPVDDHYRTSAAGVYAVGDVIPGPMLAHLAEDEGIACVEGIVTGYCHINYDAIPSVVYTHPEVAAVGRTEEELTAAGIPFRKGTFPYAANGRARALAAIQGKVKILAHAETDRVLGVHILGARAGDLIAEAAAAIEWCATAEDLARTSHAHPTLAEIVKEAALAVDGRAIHI